MKLKKVTSWSLSALHLYEQCPLKFKKQRLEGRPQQIKSPALEYGIKVHNLLEQYLLGNIKGIPKELEKFAKEIRTAKKKGAIPEQEIVMDKNWKPIKGKDAWKNPKAWLRAKLDITLNDFLVDLKTGKHYAKYREQAELYAVLLFILNPDYEEVDVEFWYSKTGDVKEYSFQRSNLQNSIDMWEYRVNKLFNEKNWEPKENQYCFNCEFKSECPIGEKL